MAPIPRPAQRSALMSARTIRCLLPAIGAAVALTLITASALRAQAQATPTPAPASPAAPGVDDAPLFASEVQRGAWLWEGNCTRCHGAYAGERVGRGIGDDFDDDDLYEAIAGISRGGCQVDWAISRGGTLVLADLRSIVSFIEAWEADPGALELGVLPPQPTPTPTSTVAANPDATATPFPTPTIPPALVPLIAQETLYEGAWLYAQECVTCHGDYARARQGSSMTIDDVREIVTNGKIGSSMPAFAITRGGKLFGRQIDAVMTYIAAWEESGQAPVLPAPLQAHLDARIAVAVPMVTPTPLPPTPNAPERGLLVFQARCAQCHGPNGDGSAGVGPPLSRLPGDAIQMLIRDTVEGGRAGTVMRAWHGNSGGPLEEGEVDDLLALLADWTALPTATPMPPQSQGDGIGTRFWLLAGIVTVSGLGLLLLAAVSTAIVPPKRSDEVDEE